MLIVVVTALADYWLKIASEKERPLLSYEFGAGAILYTFTAFGWMMVMKHMPLASIGVFYSVLTMLMLAAMGLFVFNEPITLREVLGIALAIASLGLMSRFS